MTQPCLGKIQRRLLRGSLVGLSPLPTAATRSVMHPYTGCLSFWPSFPSATLLLLGVASDQITSPKSVPQMLIWEKINSDTQGDVYKMVSAVVSELPKVQDNRNT